MPFQAFIQSSEALDASRFHIIAVITDGQTKAVKEVITSNLADLVMQLRATLAGVNSAETLKALAPGQILDLSDPVPSDAEMAQAAFLVAYSNYLSALRKVTAGLLPVDDPDVNLALKAAQAAYTPALISVG